MAVTEEDPLMPLLDSRDDYIEYLESESAGAEPTGARLRKNLVKSYVLETMRHHPGAPNPAETFAEVAGLAVDCLDEGTLYRLRRDHGVVALIEGADTRFPVIHSTRRTQQLDKLVRSTVTASPWLDHVWLPGRFFDALWRWTRDTSDPNRLAKLKFAYTGHYEQIADGAIADDIDEELEEEVVDEGAEDFDDEDVVREVRHSQFEVADRVAYLDQRLSGMRDIYHPLQSTVRIRIPSGVRGGHEVYDFGKITNRSVSFAEQEKVVRLVIDLYRRVTEDAEEKLWYSSEPDEDGGAGFKGRPVYLDFEQPLDLMTLHTWADRTFGSKRNRFRLGGHPIWSGPDRTRLHVYGIDRHLWQPISIEATRKHILAVLPRGTCGNTINRLVTNVQQFLSPSVQAWIGEFPYAELLESGNN
ncbi:MAG: hypothetical protein M3406_16105 [Chloroflexota bacterium]|nr:hypothetical protein [Chloroflexota bacterium]